MPKITALIEEYLHGNFNIIDRQRQNTQPFEEHTQVDERCYPNTYDQPRNSVTGKYKNIYLSGIGGLWASEDSPTTEELHAMRKSSHIISEL